MKSLGCTPIQHVTVLIKRGKYTHTQGSQCEDMGEDCHVQAKEHLRFWKLREQHGTCSPTPTPHNPQKEPTLLMPWFQTSSLQSWETMNFCGLANQVAFFCYSSARKHMHRLKPQACLIPAAEVHSDSQEESPLFVTEAKCAPCWVKEQITPWRQKYEWKETGRKK